MDDQLEKKFKQNPNTQASELVDYFNLEFGSYFDDSVEKFIESDFEKIGLFLNPDGIETVYWSVRNQEKLWAIVQPYAGSSLLSMTDQSPVELVKLSS